MSSSSSNTTSTPAITYVSLGMIRIDSLGNYSLNWYLLIYYLIAIGTIVSFAGFFANKGQNVAAVVVTVLLLAVYTFFGLRWYGPSPTPATAKDPNSCNSAGTTMPGWKPPIINMCPDFTVLWTDSTGNVYCYDDKNTYNMQTYNGAGLTANLNINGLSGQSAFLIKNASATAPPNLAGDTGGARWPFLFLLQNNPTGLTNDQYGKYLRWEGVWDGAAMKVQNAPLP